MRQTSKRARRSRLLMIFILVLLIALVLWGLAALADRLLHYGANATVSAKDADQPSAITPTPETADDTPKNTYDPACCNNKERSIPSFGIYTTPILMVQ